MESIWIIEDRRRVGSANSLVVTVSLKGLKHEQY